MYCYWNSLHFWLSQVFYISKYNAHICKRGAWNVCSWIRNGSSLLRHWELWLLDGTWPEAGGRGRGHTGRLSTSQKSGRARQRVTESAHSALPKTVDLRERCRSAGGERERAREKWTSLETNLGMAVPPSWMQSSKLASPFIPILTVLVCVQCICHQRQSSVWL